MQEYKKANMLVCKYESLQEGKYARTKLYENMQLCNFTSMQVCKYASM